MHVVASMQGFIKNSGQRSLNYDATNISKVAGGDTVEELEVRLGRYYAGRGRGGTGERGCDVRVIRGVEACRLSVSAQHQPQSCLTTTMSPLSPHAVPC